MRDRCTILLWIALFFMLTGCRSTVYVPVHSTSTEYLDRLERDSIYLHDSIRITVQGDTVILEKYRDRYRNRWRTDTVLRVDSIPKPYPVVEYREVNNIRWWQKALMALGCILIVVIVYKLKFNGNGKA
jgi:hypothetical protein